MSLKSSRPKRAASSVSSLPRSRANVVAFARTAESKLASPGKPSHEPEPLLAAYIALTPEQRLTVWTLVEHPRLLDGIELIVAELSEGLR